MEGVEAFVSDARKILQFHLTKAVEEGKLNAKEATDTMNTYNERVQMLTDMVQRQSGGGTADEALAAIDRYNPERIQKDIDKLMHFSPKDALPNTIEPTIEKGLLLFVPKVREQVKQIVGMIFVLGSLEKLPIFGPLVGAAMDVATVYLPVLAVSIQNILPNIIGLAPIPYAAFAGEAAGYAISSVMLFFTMFTQISRGEFVEALEASAGLVPVLGTTLMAYVGKGKKLYDKYEERREKIIGSLTEIQALLMFGIPLATTQVREVLIRFLPIVNVFVQEAKKYIEPSAEFILDNLRPIVRAAKERIREKTQKIGGGHRKIRKGNRIRRSKNKTKKHKR